MKTQGTSGQAGAANKHLTKTIDKRTNVLYHAMNVRSVYVMI